MSERLYELLPAIYRIRDAERGEPLRALLDIVQEEFDLVEQDIETLYDDWFIETAEEWVVPYIGDLLGVRPAHDLGGSGAHSQRAFVANTLRYRRRKGTLAMLEELARDVTGWDAHAVAFFELLTWSQHLDHLRLAVTPNPYPRSPERLNPPAVDRVGTVNLRSLDVVDRVHRPFDISTHSVDVRSPCQRLGWHNIRNLGFFLWRLRSYPMRFVTPGASADYGDGFHFSPLGHPAPLFTNPVRSAEVGGLATEHDVPGAIRPVAFFQDPEKYYGTDAASSLCVYRGSDVPVDALVPIPVDAILCRDLGGWSPPPPGRVAVDVRLGRLAFAPGETPPEGVTVSFHQGFSSDIGGGPYDRRATLATAALGEYAAVVAKVQPTPPPPVWHTSIADAVAAWDPATHPSALVTIADSATYEEELSIAFAGRQQLTVQAANRSRPTVRFVNGGGALGALAMSGGTGETAALLLDGLLMEGRIEVGERSLGQLELRNCTLVPGLALGEEGLPLHPAEPSLRVEPGTEANPANPELRVVIDRCITGALRLPQWMRSLTVRDSIVDRPGEAGAPPPDRIAISGNGEDPGPDTVLEGVTVFGQVRVRSLHASDVIFTERVEVRRRQEGCIRYSYLDQRASIAPRQFRCQPQLALEDRRKKLDVDVLPPVQKAAILRRVFPDFTSVRYGTPGYPQLHIQTAPEIRTGAESGAEMGVFEELKQPQREANLRVRLEEYMPYGLQAGMVFVT